MYLGVNIISWGGAGAYQLIQCQKVLHVWIKASLHIVVVWVVQTVNTLRSAPIHDADVAGKRGWSLFGRWRSTRRFCARVREVHSYIPDTAFPFSFFTCMDIIWWYVTNAWTLSMLTYWGDPKWHSTRLHCSLQVFYVRRFSTILYSALVV